LLDMNYHVSPVMDRNYFHSIYFREPGNILFEVATNDIGFTIDEPKEKLGLDLKLPEWYEIKRAEIEKLLLPINFPKL
jgi:glyoxalase family protein